MLRYFIKVCFICCFFIGNAQNKPIDTNPKDTVVHKQAYGLRIGVDLSRPARALFDSDYTGLEFIGDYRINQKYYLAAEIGNEKLTRQEDLYNFTTSGSYVKLGFDYNTYANWYGEQNLIYIGGRYAFSSFNHTLNNNQIFNSNRYWSPDGFAEGTTAPTAYNNRNASWLEFVMGIKAELFANIYLGASVRLSALVTRSKLENGEFNDLYIPGFNKVTDDSIFGIGYNFSISYFIPFYKKTKKPKKEKDTPVLKKKN